MKLGITIIRKIASITFDAVQNNIGRHEITQRRLNVHNRALAQILVDRTPEVTDSIIEHLKLDLEAGDEFVKSLESYSSDISEMRNQVTEFLDRFQPAKIDEAA